MTGSHPVNGPARTWVLTYRGRPGPERLVEEEPDLSGALLLPARAIGWTTTREARTTMSTGAVPLTLIPAHDRVLETWVLGVHPDDLRALDRVEGRGTRYELGVVGDVAVAARWHLPGALAYGPPPVPAPGWPATPLTDLDLFAYGTLQPGHVRWSLIADHVEPVGPATAAGSVWATPMGWPAATFDRDGGTVHGSLLRPRSAAAASTLYRIGDEVEGAVGHSLFVRVAVRVSGPDGPGWAAAYEWNRAARGNPPGAVVPDGRWVPGGR